MPDYAKIYYKLFNAITDTIEDLKTIQIEAEELYITSCEEEHARLSDCEVSSCK